MKRFPAVPPIDDWHHAQIIVRFRFLLRTMFLEQFRRKENSV
jgi:hypothetical protein